MTQLSDLDRIREGGTNMYYFGEPNPGCRQFNPFIARNESIRL